MNDTKQRVPLFDPLSLPVDGIFSRPHPAALGPGQWRDMANTRRDRTTIRVRDGSAYLKSTSIFATGTLRGATAVELNGTSYLLAGVYDTSVVRVYVSTDGVTWAEETAATGKFGNTRFTEVSGRFLSFQVVQDQYSDKDVVLIQNGTDNPRVFDPTEALNERMSTLYSPEAPQANNLQKTMATFRNFVSIAGATPPTFSKTGGGGMTLTNNGTNPNNNTRLTAVNPTTIGTDWVRMTFGAKDFQHSRQLIMLTEILDRYYLWWDHIKVAIVDTVGGTQVIWDPTAPATYTIERVEFDATTNKQLVAFPLDQIANSNRASVTAIEITWVGPTYTGANIRLDIFAVFASGNVQGGAQYGFAFYNRVGRCESRGMVVPVVYGERVADMGGTLLSGAKIPLRPELYYRYKLTYQKIQQAEANKGTDRILIYRANYGETVLTYVNYGTMATWSSGGGVWNASGVAFGALATINVDEYAAQNDPRRVIPDASYHLPVPVGRSMHVGNGGRLFVAGTRTPGGTGRLWVSEADGPFRFRKVASGTPYSPTVIDFAGEQITRIQAVSSSTYGSDAVHVFTTRSTYVLDGVSTYRIGTPTRIGPIGCRAPRSVAEYKGTLVFLDDDLQIRHLAGGSISDLTRDTIDDKLRGIAAGRETHVSAAQIYDRFYFAYTPAGGTLNTRILVFYLNHGKWESDDILPTAFDAAQILTWFDGATGRRKLLVFTNDARVVEYEKPGTTTDQGEAGVTVTLEPRQIHEGFDQEVTVLRVGIACEKSAGQTMAVTRTYPTTGTVMDSVIDLDAGAGNTITWRWDKDQTTVTATPRAHDTACNLKLVGLFPGGATILGIAAEVRGGSVGRGR